MAGLLSDLIYFRLPRNFFLDLFTKLMLFEYLKDSVKLPLSLVQNLILRLLFTLLFGFWLAIFVVWNFIIFFLLFFSLAAPINLHSSFLILCSSVKGWVVADFRHELKSTQTFFIFVDWATAFLITFFQDDFLVIEVILGHVRHFHSHSGLQTSDFIGASLCQHYFFVKRRSRIYLPHFLLEFSLFHQFLKLFIFEILTNGHSFFKNIPQLLHVLLFSCYFFYLFFLYFEWIWLFRLLFEEHKLQSICHSIHVEHTPSIISYLL